MRLPLLTLALAASGFAATAQAQTATPPAPPPPGNPMMRADANHDGVITRDEATADAGARFDAMDANHDGTLSPDERQAYRATMRARRMGNASADAKAPPPPPAGGYAGRDGEVSVTRADYIARAATRFDRMDANHDGRIDATEMAQMRGFGGRRGGGRMPGGDTSPPPPPSDQ